MKNLIKFLVIAGLTVSCSNESQKINTETSEIASPKNIIMVIGDGMGPVYTTAYRYFKDDPSTPDVENTVFDRHLTGMSSTYPDTSHHYVTDSAASATALSSGTKTYNGAIAVNMDKDHIETVLERAKNIGKKTGVVVTSQINHATPASYLTHNESRQNYNAIADSYIDEGIIADVYLGGGWQYFIREDRNLVNEFKEKSYTYVDNYQALADAPSNRPLLGLFGERGLPSALDDSNKHRLSLMTQKAIQHIENPNGYFLLIEASQIDWAGHANDVASAMAEMDDLAKTLEYLEIYVKENPDTLVIVTADHSTGGMSLGTNGIYEWKPQLLSTMTQSPNSIAAELEKSEITNQNTQSLFNVELTQDELNALITTKQNAPKDDKLKDVLSTAVKNIINERTHTGWTSSGHTAIDVPVFAMGSHKNLFNGYQDNTDIGNKVLKFLQK